MRLRSTIFAAMVVLSSCRDASPTGEELPLAGMAEEVELLTAPPEAAIEGTRVTLRADAARDAMPGTPSGALMVRAVLESESGPIPEGVVMEHLYVLRGERVWSTPFTEPPRPAPVGQLERIARDGPLWSQDRIDIVVRVRTQSGQPLYLAARHQEITILQ